MIEPPVKPRKERRFWPSRAIYAELGGHRATATWQLKRGNWICCSASRWLKWMRGMTDFKAVKAKLFEHGYSWHWLPTVMQSAPKPPF